jgi:tRNA pseudouridine55 synthase
MKETDIQVTTSLKKEGSVLFIDKPLDWTSFDVVKKVRSALHERKVGHAGTLDPKATGLLIVCIGKMTKSIDRFVGLEKEYTGSFELGIRTSSFDSETEVIERHDWTGVPAERIAELAKELTGAQMQVPPMYSALKYGGKPLYEFVRAGKVVERAEREIVVSQFSVDAERLPLVDFCVVCSKGTYIRSLIDELGQRLGCGAVLRSLRRMRIGAYHVRDAWTIAEMIAQLNVGNRLTNQLSN